MEQLNRIELRGTVGSIRVQTISEKHVARISLVTNYVYKSKDGDPVIETTWHNISAWENKSFPDLTTIQKGDRLHVLGRLRNQRFLGSDGIERTSCEVSANRLQKIEPDGAFNYEF